MTELIGEVFSKRYRIDAFLGRGAMAEVYKAWDQERSTFLALKMLRQDLAHDLVFFRRFEREARTLEKLQHPNIVRFYGIEQDQIHVFILMDYIEGTTLQTELFLHQHQPFDQEGITHILQPICSALNYAHNMGMVHCDIKPGNIMINKYDELLLTDFGIARMTDTATSTMVGFGTPAYMAPELVQGREPSPQSDIYALGIILFQMVTGGERPFTGEQASIAGTVGEKVRWEQSNLAPPSPRIYNPEISKNMEAVVLRCLSKSANSRFGSMIEMLNAIERAYQTPDQISTVQPPLAEAVVPELVGESPEDQKRDIQPAVPAGEIGDEPVGSHLQGATGITHSKAQLKGERQTVIKSKAKWMIPAILVPVMIIIIVLVISLGKGKGDPIGQAALLPSETSTVTKTILPSLTNTIIPSPTITNTAFPSLTNTVEVLGVGSTKVNDRDNQVMVYVPEGEFIMGSDDVDVINYPTSAPAHAVYLDAYWIYRTEVTNAQYVEFLNDYGDTDENGNHMVSSDKLIGIILDNEVWKVINEDSKDLPVVKINWYGANAYCNWAGGRLPTEAEWEKAARGDDERDYPWGNKPPDSTLANFSYNYGELIPVGSLEAGASPFGALDMAGNAEEWVSDSFSTIYYRNSPYENPTGPDRSNDESLWARVVGVFRGGSFASTDIVIKVWYRVNGHSMDTFRITTGFRCVIDAEP